METEIGREPRVLTADDIFDFVREDLHAVEDAIDLESAASAETVKPISHYLRQNRKEHPRATLLLLCARFAGAVGTNSMAIRLGAVVEMLHAARLVHSGAFAVEQLGRVCPSPNASWANGNCVLAGDWLFLRAFRAALQDGVFHLVIGAAQMMVTAELTQVNRIGSIDVTEVDCLELADCKTARLFSVCGKLGAVVAGADERVGKTLSEYAWNLGMAFQLIDDLLDFASSESTAAKPDCGHLKEGKITLPLVYALEAASVSERNLVAGVLRDRRDDDVEFADVLAIVHRYRGIERTRARARQFTDRARQIMAEVPDSIYGRALLAFTQLAAERKC